MVSSLLVGADEGFLQGGRGDVGGAWSRGESVEGLHRVSADTSARGSGRRLSSLQW